MSQQTRAKAYARKRLLIPAVAAALALAYALGGFLLAPWIAGRELPRFIEDQLHHRARIGEISFNPFTLRLQAREFALETREGRPVLAFADAVVDLEWHSLLRRAWVLDEVRLVDPAVHVEIAKDGRLNLAALVPDTGSTATAQPARFAIGHFSVINGSIAFEDHRQGYRNRAERLSIELSSLSTLEHATGPYALAGQTPGGAKLHWKGEATLAPLAATGTLAVQNMALAELMPYVDDFTAARVVAGRADLELPYHLALAEGKPRFSLNGANVHVRELGLSSSGEKALLTKFGAIALGGIDFDWGKQHVLVKSLRVGESSVTGAKEKLLLAKAGPLALDGAEFALASGHGSARELAIAQLMLAAGDEAKPSALLRQLAFDDIAFELPAQRVSAKSLRVAELNLAVRRDANGELDVLRLFAGGGDTGEAKGGAKPAVWQASIGVVELGNGSARYNDARAKTPLALTLVGLSARFGFEAASAGEGVRVRLDAGNFALDKLDALAGSASPGSTPQPAVNLAKLSFGGVRYDSGANLVEAASVRLDAGDFAVNALNALAGSASAWSAPQPAVKLAKLSLDGVRYDGSANLVKAASIRLDAGNVALGGLDGLAGSASRGSAPQPAVKLAKLSFDGVRYDGGANLAEAATVRLGNFGVDAALENGRLSLLDFLPAAGESKSAKPLTARVKAFELGEGAINFTDRDRGIALALERIALKLNDASTDGAKPLAFELSADVKSGGRIALRGRAVPAQGNVEAKIDASSVALAPVQAVLERYMGVKFASGDVSLSGMLRAGGEGAKLAYSGSASIANLALDDPGGARLFGWKVLATESLKATLSPDRIDIDELRLTAPVGRFAIAKDGTSNISRAFAGNQTAAGRSKPPATEASVTRAAEPDAAAGVKADEAKSGAEGAFAVAVRRLSIEQGALDFSDDSLSQSFVAKIVDLAGTANGLSTSHDTRSQFAFEGRVDEFGYARISGTVNPFAPRNRSTFRVQMRNVDLVTATPYAMRFAGYRIATGRLGLDLNYRVRDSAIEGDNKITLEQFTLGERVDSPDALKLPFELAVKLLKDPDGMISLELPVKGSLDDPQFSLAPLIWKALGHLIGNIVAAPFRALANLFGGGSGEDLGVIAFDPGNARLLPPEREKIARVAAALAKRPELKLMIPAHYDTEADGRAMKRATLGRDIARRAGFAVAEDDEPGPVNIEDRPTRRALRTIFTERSSKAELDRLSTEAEAKARAAGLAAPSVATRLRNLASGEPQLADTREFHQTLLRRLRETQTVPANALTELAQKRALAIETALKAAGADAARISRTIAEPSADAGAKQVTVRLALAAH